MSLTRKVTPNLIPNHSFSASDSQGLRMEFLGSLKSDGLRHWTPEGQRDSRQGNAASGVIGHASAIQEYAAFLQNARIGGCGYPERCSGLVCNAPLGQWDYRQSQCPVGAKGLPPKQLMPPPSMGKAWAGKGK